MRSDRSVLVIFGSIAGDASSSRRRPPSPSPPLPPALNRDIAIKTSAVNWPGYTRSCARIYVTREFVRTRAITRVKYTYVRRTRTISRLTGRLTIHFRRPSLVCRKPLFFPTPQRKKHREIVFQVSTLS